jgi:hypothetical protein
MPTNILDTAAAAWNKRKEENKASKQQSLRDGSSTGTGFSKTSTSMLVDPPTNSASTDVASVTGTSIGNTSIVNAAIVDASTQTCSTLSTHISLEQMIMKTFDDSCHMLISEIGLEAENNSENRFAIWTSLDYQQRFDRVRSVGIQDLENKGRATSTCLCISFRWKRPRGRGFAERHLRSHARRSHER